MGSRTQRVRADRTLSCRFHAVHSFLQGSSRGPGGLATESDEDVFDETSSLTGGVTSASEWQVPSASGVDTGADDMPGAQAPVVTMRVALEMRKLEVGASHITTY